MNYRDDKVTLTDENGQYSNIGGNTIGQYKQWKKEGRDLWYIVPYKHPK